MLEGGARFSFFVSAACLASLAAGAEGAAEEAARFTLSGYYKNILSRSETVFPAGERYTLDLNRLRLELRGRPADPVEIDVQYDNEVLLGSYLHTAQFQIQKNQKPAQYWDLESAYVDRSSYYGLQSIYRATVTASKGDTDARFGRQRIAWGNGRFWSPLDVLNPFSATQLEREERVGIDALLVEHKLDALSRLSAVYAPWHDSGDATEAVQWHGNRAGVDFSFVGGKFRGDHMVGVGLAGQIGGAGIRGELSDTRPQTGAGYRRAVAGLDYAFRNTLSVTVEIYYNGAGTTEGNYDFVSLFAGRIRNVGRHYAGAYAGYEITPLLKWNNYLVVNTGDRSRYFSPSLAYSVRTNVELTAGVQLFGGAEGTEYGTFNDVYYAQMQWFF